MGTCPSCKSTDIAETIPVFGLKDPKDMVCLDCGFEWKKGGHKRGGGWQNR